MRHGLNSPAIVVLSLMAIALAISLLLLARESVWFDEAVTVRVALFREAAFRKVITEREPFWAFHYLLMRAWISPTADASFWIRLPSALAIVAAVGCTYLAGRRLVGHGPALVASLILCVHPFAIQYAVEARGYAIATALTAGATLAFAMAMEKPRGWHWCAYAVLAIGAVYAHFFAALVIVGHGVVLLRRERSWIMMHGWKPGAAWLVAAVATWPLASWLIAAEQTRGFMRPVGVDSLVRLFGWVGGASVLRPLPFFAAMAVAAAALLTVGIWFLMRDRAGVERWRPALVVSWLVTPIVLSVLVSLFSKPVFTPRYLVVALPAVALIVGVAIHRMSRGPVRVAIVGLTFAVLCLGASPMALGHTKPDWNAVVDTMRETARPGDVMIIQPWFQRAPVLYAMDQIGTKGQVELLPAIASDAEAEAAISAANGSGRVWVILFDYEVSPDLDSLAFASSVRADAIELDVTVHRVRLLRLDPSSYGAVP